MKLIVSRQILSKIILIIVIINLFSLTENKRNKRSQSLSKNGYYNSPRIISMGYVTDKSSIYSPNMVVDLLIELSGQICRINSAASRNILADCLSNLKNNPRRWENNMKYFWNVATDLVKRNNDSFIVERTFADAFAMVSDYRVRQNGQSCGKMFVMNFNAETAKRIIRHYLRRFNLVQPKRKFISSFIGVHRRMAPAGFFWRLNRGGRAEVEIR